MHPTVAPAAALRRATRWFWALTVMAVLLVGALSRELTAHPSPKVGLAVAVTGVLLVLVVTQASRLMLAIGAAAPARGPRGRSGDKARCRARSERVRRSASGRRSVTGE